MSVSSPPPPEVMSWPELLKGTARVVGWMLLRMICFGIAVALVIVFGIFMMKLAFSPDLPWLFASGDYMLKHHALPAHDLFSWTYPDKPWVLYQWLFEVIIAWIRQQIGLEMTLRLFAVTVLGLFVLIPFFRDFRRGIPSMFTLVIASMALFTAAVNMSLRPMVVTTILLLAQYLMVHRYRSGRLSPRLLFPAIAVVYLLWGNMHTGVTLGFISLLLMAVGDAVERSGIYVFDPAVPACEGKPLGLKCYAGLALIGFLASLVNPYGFGIYTYITELSAQKGLNDSIIELMSPNFHIINYWAFAALFIMFILLMSRARRCFSAQEILHLMVFTLTTFYAQRFVVWAALFYAYILPKAFYQVSADLFRLKPNIQAEIQRFEFFRPLFMGSVVLLAIVYLFFHSLFLGRTPVVKYGLCDTYITGINAYYNKYKRREDRLFEDAEIGSCILIEHPEEKVFIDTRFDFYGQKFTKQSSQTLDLMGNWKATLRRWKINTLMVSKNWSMARVLTHSKEYQTIYEDKALLILRSKTP
jgi:hypothetical protein